jgi:hypothetical protein
VSRPHPATGGPLALTARARLAVAQALCAVAARGLPRRVRARFAEEWRADLVTEPDRALRYAASLLVHLLRLRAAVTADAAVAEPGRRPLACRLHLHRYVTVHDNPENRRFTSHHCRRCGHVKDDWRGPGQVNDGMVWGASAGLH